MKEKTKREKNRNWKIQGNKSKRKPKEKRGEI